MIPRLVNGSCEYVRPSAVAWSLLGTSQCQKIDHVVASAIADLARLDSKSPLVVDCRDIVRVQDHAFDAIVDTAAGTKAAAAIQAAERGLIFWLPKGDLNKQFQNALGPAAATYSDKGGLLSLYGKRFLDRDEAVKEFDEAQSLLLERARGWVGGCFRPWDNWQRLQSTPLLANGYFDSRSILSSPQMFQWTCVALRDLVTSLLPMRSSTGQDEGQEQFIGRGIGLLAVSLRASALAAGIATLLGDYFVNTLSVVDHAGPRKRIFERSFLEELPDGSDLVLVSDFVIGGSELRAAEILAEYRGGQLVGAVCLGTALRPEEYNALCEIRALAHLPSCAKDFRCTFLG